MATTTMKKSSRPETSSFPFFSVLCYPRRNRVAGMDKVLMNSLKVHHHVFYEVSIRG